jgi:hypothetical protein
MTLMERMKALEERVTELEVIVGRGASQADRQCEMYWNDPANQCLLRANHNGQCEYPLGRYTRR